jgi:hypothetical protein
MLISTGLPRYSALTVEEVLDLDEKLTTPG